MYILKLNLPQTGTPGDRKGSILDQTGKYDAISNFDIAREDIRHRNSEILHLFLKVLWAFQQCLLPSKLYGKSKGIDNYVLG